MAPRSSIDKGDIEIVEQEPSHLESASRVFEIGEYRVLGLSNEDADFFQNFPEKKRKHVFHKVSILSPSHSRRQQLTCIKVDRRLIPMLASLYLMCHIDRANIGNAKIEGMVTDLGMTGVQYNTVLSICEYSYPGRLLPSTNDLVANVLTHDISLCPIRSLRDSQ